MPLAQYAAPKPQKVRLPTVPITVGSYRTFEPKPTAANYYTPTTSGLPKPVAVTPRKPVVSAQPSIDAAQAAAAAGVNYTALLENDPYLRDALRAIGEQESSYQAALTAARRRALVQYGDIPANLSSTAENLVGNWNVDIDDTTRALADAATRSGISTVAMENRAFSDATSQYLSSLAGRGMLRSGALGQRFGETQLAREQTRHRDLTELTDYMISLYQNYLGQLDEGNLARAGATKEALDRIIAQIALLQPEPEPPPPATPPGPDYPPASTDWPYEPVPFDPYPIPVIPPATPTTGGFINYPTLGTVGGQLPATGNIYSQLRNQLAPKRTATKQPYYQSGAGPYGYKPLY